MGTGCAIGIHNDIKEIPCINAAGKLVALTFTCRNKFS